MSFPKVTLYVQVHLSDGRRTYLKPVISGNKKLKEGWAYLKGQPQRFDVAIYYLRYRKAGKPVWQRLTRDAEQALAAKRQLETRLRAVVEGIELAPVPKAPEPVQSPPGRPILDCIKSYLDEITYSGEVGHRFR